jgi:hypothetical protein
MKLRRDGPPEAPATVILAHGAGAGMDSPAMTAFAEGLAAAGLHAVRFEFPYMQRRRESGKRGGPDRAPVLLESWRQVIDGFDREQLIIGGKSMGGRIASMVADDAGVRGLVCLGYPFHPPGRPEKLRTEHLAGLRTPTLIVQGTRDPFGDAEEVPGYELSPAITVHWLEDGDHSFKPRKSSGQTLEQNLEEAIAAIVAFIEGLGNG